MLSYVLPHTFALTGLTVLFYLPGFIAERRWHLAPPSSRHLTRFILGVAFWSIALFACAVLHVLRTPVVWTIIAIVILSASTLLVEQWRHPIQPQRADAEARDPRHRLSPANLRSAIPWTAVVLVLGASYVLALRPTLAWDADTYHLTVPRLFLEHSGFRRIPFNVYSNWPMDVELLFGLGMMLYDHLLATLIHPLFACLTVLAIARACTANGAEWAGPVAACAFLANEVVLFESGIAYVDIALAFFFVMSIAYIVDAHGDFTHRRRSLLLAGVCCGLMAGSKLLGWFGVAGVVANLGWDALRDRRLRAAAREVVLYIALPTVLLAGPWYLKSAWYTGNPVYPLAYPLLDGREWDGELNRQYQNFMGRIGDSHSLRDYALLPERVVMEGGPRYEQFGGRLGAFWIALLPLVAVKSWTSRKVRRWTLPAGVYFVFWAASSQQARFLIPVLPLLAIASAISLAELSAGSIHPAVSRVLRWGLAVAGASYLIVAAAQHLSQSRSWLREYREHPRAMRHAGVLPMYDYINERLRPDARVMLLNTNHGFFCRREYIADSFFEASQLNELLLRPAQSKLDLARALNREHITHILVGHWHWNIPYPPALGELLNDPLMARLLYESPERDRLYVIHTRVGIVNAHISTR